MKFLLCMGGAEPSMETIRFGGRLAKAFEADISVLYVQPRVPHAVKQELKLAREKLSEWEIEVPGIKVLRAAREILIEEGFVPKDTSGQALVRHALKQGVRGAYELHIFGVHGENIRLRLREGDIISEVNKEVESFQHDLVIFGASRERRLLQKLVQFINCSMLIVKNPRRADYDFLICTDGTPASRKAELFGAKLSKFQSSSATVLSVARTQAKEAEAHRNTEHAVRLLTRAGIPHKVIVLVGDVVDHIAAMARENTIVVMGDSRMSELKKFIFGSKATELVERVPCPIFIVR